MVAVGSWTAVVATNTATELQLAPVRPGATTAWAGSTPPAGAGYRLPDVPGNRAGVALANGRLSDLALRHNRVWDGQQRKSQTHGLWVTSDGIHGSAELPGQRLRGQLRRRRPPVDTPIRLTGGPRARIQRDVPAAFLTPTAELGAATGIEFGPGGRLIAVAEPVRRGGGTAGVVRPG